VVLRARWRRKPIGTFASVVAAGELICAQQFQHFIIISIQDRWAVVAEISR